MRARDPRDYSSGDDKGIKEGERLGQMGGEHKDKMNSMFDTRGRDSENYHKNLMDALENNKKKYDKQLYTDWVLKVY